MPDDEPDVPWNYRIVRDRIGDAEFLSIREAWYDRQGIPRSIAPEPSPPAGETVQDVEADLKTMLLAVERPVLDAADFARARGGSADSTD